MPDGDKHVSLAGLKAVYDHLDSNISGLKSTLNYTEVELEKNKGINTAGTNATPVLPENMGSSNAYSGAVVSCTPGEVFQITGKGGDGPRLWAFADNEGTVLAQEIPNAERVDYLITAPSGAAYFAYNCQNNYAGTPKVYRNATPDVRLKKVESAAVDSALGYIKNTGYSKPVVTRKKYIDDDGIDAESTKYAGTDLFVPERNIAIGIENDLYVYQIAGYSANGNTSNGTGFIGKTNPMDKPMVIPNDWEKIAVMFFKKNNDTIGSGTASGTDVYAIREAFTFYTLVDTELSTPYVPADAKTTGDRLSAVEPMANAAFPGCLNIVSINHRGYHVDAPENTIPAFIQSRKMGFDAVETDVRFTQDGVPVLLHNDTLDGICCLASDGSAITGNLAINSIDSSNLSAYDACTPAKWAKYKGTKIPTLREFLVLCRKIGLHPYLEIKTGATAELVATCIGVVQDCGMLDHVVWFSSDKTVLGHVHTALPEATLAIYESETILDGDVTDALALKTAGNEVIMWVRTSENLSANITKCKNAGLTLYLGTNAINDILSIDPYISGVNSDTLHAGKILFDSVMNAE